MSNILDTEPQASEHTLSFWYLDTLPILSIKSCISVSFIIHLLFTMGILGRNSPSDCWFINKAVIDNTNRITVTINVALRYFTNVLFAIMDNFPEKTTSLN